jgi:ssDNA-binding replication factor A large subunit
LKVKDLAAGMDGVTIRGRIVKISEKIEVETKFEKSPLAVALLEDETGSIRLNLWRGQIDLVKVGDEVIVEHGFVRSFKDQAELNVGSRGRIIVISRG